MTIGGIGLHLWTIYAIHFMVLMSLRRICFATDECNPIFFQLQYENPISTFLLFQHILQKKHFPGWIVYVIITVQSLWWNNFWWCRSSFSSYSNIIQTFVVMSNSFGPMLVAMLGQTCLDKQFHIFRIHPPPWHGTVPLCTKYFVLSYSIDPCSTLSNPCCMLIPHGLGL